MKIRWKRILIAALWSELVLFAIYLADLQYGGSARDIIVYLNFAVFMFLGGLWVVRKIESRFVLHGLLVGVVANILFIPLSPLIFLTQPFMVQELTSQVWIALLFESALKILASAAGAYVGGRQKIKMQPTQAGKLPS